MLTFGIFSDIIYHFNFAMIKFLINYLSRHADCPKNMKVTFIHL